MFMSEPDESVNQSFHLVPLSAISFTQRKAAQALTFPGFRFQIYPELASNIFGVCALQGNAVQGLVLARRVEEGMAKEKEGAQAELLSLFVQTALRQNGLGKTMLLACEEEARKQGISEMSCTYTSALPQYEAVNNLLRSCHWEDPSPRILFCRGDSQYMLDNATWLDRVPSPDDFEIFLWRDLKKEERDAIEKDIVEGLAPEELSPFYDEEHMELRNSLGLRHKGKVIGWQVNHALPQDPGVLRYSRTYVYSAYQRTGRGILLIRESIVRHRNPDLLRDYPRYLSDVAFERPEMVRFYERYLIPYSKQAYRSYGSRKIL